VVEARAGIPFTLWSRLLRAAGAPFLVAVVVLALLALLLLVLRVGEVAPGAAFDGADLLPIFGYGLPQLATFAVPIAWLIALLLSLGQFAADGAYVAARAAGLGPLRLCLPLFGLGILLCGGLFVLSAHVAPKANRHIRAEIARLAKIGAVSGLRAGRFNDAWQGVTLYIGRRGEAGRLHYVMIADDRDAEIRLVAFARDGRIVASPDRERVSVRLEAGELHSLSRDGRLFRRAMFESYAFQVDIEALLSRRLNFLGSFDDLSFRGLREYADKLRREGRLDVWRFDLLYHRKVASAAVPLLFVFFAVALGLGARPTRAPRVRASLWAVALVAVYFGLQRAGDALAFQLAAPIAVCAWLPAIVLAPFALWLLWRLERGRR
jgi:lipopolysaccharide export LptBFGC system permease protein LptF